MYATGSQDACERVRAWIEEQMEALGSDAFTRTFVGAGFIAWDDACGTLVVVPERVWRYTSWPIEATGVPENCWGGSLAISVDVILIRCLPGPDEQGNAPTQEELAEAYAAFLLDADRVLNIVNGDLPDSEWLRASVNQTFTGEQGGAIAVETRFSLGLEQDAWCPLQ